MNVRRRLRRVTATAALLALAVPLLASLAPQAGASGAESGQSTGVLRVIGKLPDPIGAPKHPQRSGSVIAVDDASRRMFYKYTDTNLVSHVITYDMRPRIPKQVATGVLGPEGDFVLATSFTVAYDSKRRQLALITPTLDAGGKSAPTGTASIVVFSDVSHKVVAKWNVAQSLPGYYTLGITYSAADDRYYAAGEFSSQQFIAEGGYVGGGKAVGPGSAIVALNPTNGALKWLRSVPECQQVLYSKGIGSLIARSRAQNALYFACVSGGTPGGQTYPGQAGLIRLHIDPAAADSAAAAKLPLELFAISGNYYSGGQGSGVTAFDPTTDRFFLQSLSFQTPGTYVFDGRLTAWVGFTPAASNADYYIGLNSGLGHLYIGMRRGSTPTEKTDGIVVANMRYAVEAGEFDPLISSTLITADAGSNRLYVRPNDTNAPYLVVEDLKPRQSRRTPEDYDAQTTDTADTATANITFAGSAFGFGAESVQVGGTGAPLTGVSQNPADIPGVAPGTRAVMGARGALDLRDGGAAAGADAAQADINTMQEYERQDPDGDGHGEVWPYPAGTCLDAGGRATTNSFRDNGPSGPANGGTFKVSCDLGKYLADTTSTMGASGSGATTANRSAYEAHAFRNRKDGAVVSTIATSEGVTFDVAGGLTVRLGRVVSTTLTTAHGRPGTAHALWTRDVEGVRVSNATGPIYTGSGCTSKVEAGPDQGKRASTDTCSALADAVNKVLPTRFRIQFPMPYVVATPMGAFAAVEQSEADYLQQTTVNDQGVIYRGDSVGVKPVPAVVTETYTDTAERSRTVTVLAATQSSVNFDAQPPYDQGSFGGGGGTGGGGGGGTSGGTTPGVPGTSGTTPGGTVTPGTSVTGPAPQAGIPVRDLGGYLLMRRSLRDAALLVLLAGLVLGGCGTAWRRRRLVQVLVTVTGKEAL
ncbi:MAG: hypothetical protein QOE45_2436 [Frankiaceae bacterium]|jgi:hypothetical protein|nr:hypothetical protein [Frankiaceae bacterium]